MGTFHLGAGVTAGRGPGQEEDQPGNWLFGILPQIEMASLWQLGSDGDPDNWTATQLTGAKQRIMTPLLIACPSDSSRAFRTKFHSGSHTPRGSEPCERQVRGDYLPALAIKSSNSGPKTWVGDIDGIATRFRFIRNVKMSESLMEQHIRIF